MKYHSKCLKEPLQNFCEEIYEDLLARKDKIVAPPEIESSEQLIDCVVAIRNDYPELFYVDFHSVSYMKTSSYSYIPKYRYSKSETDIRIQKYEKTAQKIASYLKKMNLNSIYDKAMWIHNYIVCNCTYNNRAVEQPEQCPTAYTMEGFFQEHTAVCQGIALTYQYLCNYVGVRCILATGLSIHPGSKIYERHAWNIVEENSYWHQIDVTWDMCLTRDKTVRYDYFGLPDIDMMRDHQYVKYPFCNSKRETYFARYSLQFETLEQIQEYTRRTVVRTIELNKEKGLQDKNIDVRLYFKVCKRKYTVEQISQGIVDAIFAYARGSISYHNYWNDTQSVFEYYIQIQVGK